MERTTICISAARGWRWKQPDATPTIAPRSCAPRPPSLLSQPPFNHGLRFLPLIRTVVMAPRRALSAATVSAIAASAVMAVLSAAAAPAAAAPIMARDGAAIIAAAPLVDLKGFPNDEEPKHPATDADADAVVAPADALEDSDDAGADGDTAKVDAADASGLSTTARVGPVEEEVDATKPAGQTDGEDDLEKGPVVRANNDVAADKAAGGDAQTDGEDDLEKGPVVRANNDVAADKAAGGDAQTDGEDDLEKGPVVRANNDVAADKAAGGDVQTDGEDDLKADAARDATDDEVEVVLPEMEPTSAPDEDQVDAEDDPVVELVDVLDEAEEEIPVVEAST
ncbi:hypothetical protein BU14_0608s0019 [Porphyra umbilicalis]|uniref:Uncharacterized protein n=1 Tax=Porphyra umbilicalis TaxID=2786 RepID=A0A1X6NR42_PORUM|nr:hypothetical protein BU14_0608s0019 [Porphyra umbilicalis]|eukprot:OSX71074.1 hypothetical protein BU14_0608s0019 [Porphyra umbilicalis]